MSSEIPDFSPAALTADVPGVDFRARATPEDFVVGEVRQAETGGAGGDGTHVHFEIEKRGLDTAAAVRRLARALGRRPNEFGRAGRKDANGVTRQALSLEHVEPEALLALELDGLRVLSAWRRDRKLKPGQLLANEFRLVLREVEPGGAERIDAVLERLVREGLPNAYGPQRFGRTGDGPELGRLLLTGDGTGWLARAAELYPPGPLAPARRRLRAGRDVMAALPRELASLHLGALAAAAFNGVLDRRLTGPRPGPADPGPADQGQSGLGTLCQGDLAWRHADGAVFLVEDPRAEQARLAAWELSPSGPLAGGELLLAQGQPGEIEREVLQAWGAAPEAWCGLPRGLGQSGARRPLRVPVSNLEVEHAECVTQLSFRLPKGSFATALLAELSKGRARLG